MLWTCLFGLKTGREHGMSMIVQGTIERKGLGMGAWAIVTPQGKTYELYKGGPSELRQSGLSVQIQGQVRDDVMTLAMIGPVLEVVSFEVIER